MKTTLLCTGRVLVVGDGDFSFSLALLMHSNLTSHQLYTSSLESETSILHHAQAAENMTRLKDLGVTVLLETDARELHNHSVVKEERFERIIFNFPLADRHNIKKNRSLLADFFLSCRYVLTFKGKVLVTLCKGQGGTPADRPIRSWHDSWQIVAMATNAGFFLHEVIPFDPSDFPDYHSVGFRFQDKSFDVTGALTHVFEEGVMVDDVDCNVRGVVQLDGQSFSCSNYVASSLSRNHLDEPKNPLFILRQDLENRLKNNGCSKIVHIKNDCNILIPSHNSAAYISEEEKGDCSDVEGEVSDMTKFDKECENRKRMAHGVACKNEEELAKSNIRVDPMFSTFLPAKEENVYILVKRKEKVVEKSNNDGKDSDVRDGQRSGESDKFSGNVSQFEACMNNFSSHGVERNEGSSVSENSHLASQSEGFHQAPVLDSPHAQKESLSVYHCRTSLLENLPHLCQILNEKIKSECDSLSKDRFVTEQDGPNVQKCLSNVSDIPGDCSNRHQNRELPSVSASPNFPTTSGSSAHYDAKHTFPKTSINSHACVIAFGQCLLPCPILPSITPLKYEMLILHEINQTGQSQSPKGDCIHSNQCHLDFISSSVVDLLQTLISNSSKSNMSLIPNDFNDKIVIGGIDESHLLGRFILNSDRDSANENTQTSQTIGLVIHSKIGECLYHVSVINLTHLVCCLCGIDDPRLLWSDSDKFLNQFQSDLSLCQYHPFNLYPMKFVHDLSFWENEIDSEVFDIFSLYEVIHNIAGDLVINVGLLDIYKEPDSNRRSRCYRLYFMSSDKCLTYVASWKLQSRIRIEVARCLGVQLR